MQTATITIRPAIQTDLDDINLIITAAVMTWNLPDRVKRLSLPSYYYHELDLEHLEIALALRGGLIVGIASWEEADKKNTPDNQSALLLHGLYVHPDVQNQGIGKQLLLAAENAALHKGFDGLLVKAQIDAINYFLKQGMVRVKAQNQSHNYAHRLWKPVSNS